MPEPDQRNAIKVQKMLDLKRALERPEKIFLARTPQRDMSILPVEPPLTLHRLIDLMKSFLDRHEVNLEVMDSGEEAFVFRFIELESTDGDLIDLYVKVKFAVGRTQLLVFAAHPDRRW